MKWTAPVPFLLAAICSMAAACSHRVALYCDGDTPCTDPARPFCDLEGKFAASEGISNTCIPDPNPGGADASTSDARLAFDAATDAAMGDAMLGDACVPNSCSDLGATCGQQDDGCGGTTTSCGSCSDGLVCSGVETCQGLGCVTTMPDNIFVEGNRAASRGFLLGCSSEASFDFETATACGTKVWSCIFDGADGLSARLWTGDGASGPGCVDVTGPVVTTGCSTAMGGGADFAKCCHL